MPSPLPGQGYWLWQGTRWYTDNRSVDHSIFLILYIIQVFNVETG